MTHNFKAQRGTHERKTKAVYRMLAAEARKGRNEDKYALTQKNSNQSCFSGTFISIAVTAAETTDSKSA